MEEILAPKGVFAAASTPLLPRYGADYPRLLDHCLWLLENGCDGIAPLGTTGEANSLGIKDRISLIERLAGSSIPNDRIIVGTGSASLADTIDLSLVALDAGIRGLLMLPPFYYKSPTEEGLRNYFLHVADCLGPREPQIFLYNFPAMTSVPITLELTASLRKACPGTFVGMKDSSGDFDNTKRFLDAFPGFAVYSGTETFAARNLEAGGWGCISATTNVTAPVVARRIAETDPERSALLDTKINDLRATISSAGNVSGTKAILASFRKDDAWRRVIPPNVEIGLEEAERLAERVQEIAELKDRFR